MGREVKRVPLDFDWPIHKVWHGYLEPKRLHGIPCRACDETGLSPEAWAIMYTFYPHQIDGPLAARQAWHDKLGQLEVDNLISYGRLGVWRDGTWRHEPRTAAEINALERRGAGVHDAINRTLLVRFRCERLGIETDCAQCDGHGETEAYPGQRAERGAWEWTEPPTGEGWQVWETVSEGSPVSPVFPSKEALIDWCVAEGYTKAAARGFVESGYVPSLTFQDGRIYSGIEAGALSGGTEQ